MAVDKMRILFGIGAVLPLFAGVFAYLALNTTYFYKGNDELSYRQPNGMPKTGEVPMMLGVTYIAITWKIDDLALPAELCAQQSGGVATVCAGWATHEQITIDASLGKINNCIIVLTCIPALFALVANAVGFFAAMRWFNTNRPNTSNDAPGIRALVDAHSIDLGFFLGWGAPLLSLIFVVYMVALFVVHKRDTRQRGQYSEIRDGQPINMAV